MYLSNTPSCGRRGQVREQGATVQCRLRAEIPFKSLTNICSTLEETITIRHLRHGNYTPSNFKASEPNLFRISLIVVPFSTKKEKKGENFPDFSRRNSIFDVGHFGEREIGNGSGKVGASV